MNIKQGWLLTFKVNNIANSRCGAPKGGIRTQHRGASKRKGLDGCWVEGGGGMCVYVCVCVGGVECLCAGLIILSTEWAHITKDLLSLAGELLQSGNSAQPFSLPGDRNMWPSSAFGREVQTTTNPVFVPLSLSLSLAYKAASVSGGWRTLPLTGPCFAVSLLSISNLSPPGTATYSLCA